VSRRTKATGQRPEVHAYRLCRKIEPRASQAGSPFLKRSSQGHQFPSRTPIIASGAQKHETGIEFARDPKPLISNCHRETTLGDEDSDILSLKSGTPPRIRSISIERRVFLGADRNASLNDAAIIRAQPMDNDFSHL